MSSRFGGIMDVSGSTRLTLNIAVHEKHHGDEYDDQTSENKKKQAAFLRLSFILGVSL